MIKLKNLLFDSEPIVAHCPGPLHENWESFAEEVFAAAPASRPSQESAIFLTWHGPDRAEKPNGLLERCAARHGCEFVVLRHESSDWTNARKLAMTAEALEKTGAEFVVGLDSCDVLLVDHPDEIVRRFRTHFACDLLFNATGSACWPELPKFVMFESSLPDAKHSHGRCWLNSGAFVGRTSFCREYFRALAEFASENGYENDQTVVKATWPHYYPRVQIDYRCEILQWFNEDPRYLRTQTPRSERELRLLNELRTLEDAAFGVLIGAEVDAEMLLSTFPKLRLWIIDASDARCASGEARKPPRGTRPRWCSDRAAISRRHSISRNFIDAASGFPDRSLDFVAIAACCEAERLEAMTHWTPKLRTNGLWL